MTNLQGDVVQINDVYGNPVATYMYNAWGEIISSSGTLANVNPLRYRGYYYDTETGLYYLNSRYYDPATCRFINADTSDTLLANPSALTDKNLFAYCDNNPVMRKDDGGEFWNVIIGAAVGAAISAVTTVAVNIATKKDWNEGLLTAAASGAISGGFAATGFGVGVQMGVNAVLSAGENVIAQAKDKGLSNVDWGETATAFAFGAAAGAAGGPGVGSKHYTKLGFGTIKRALNAFKSNGISAAKTAFSKAMQYFGKHTTKLFSKIIGRRALIRGSVISGATAIAKNYASIR